MNRFLLVPLVVLHIIIGFALCFTIPGCSKDSSPSSSGTTHNDEVDLGQLEQKIYTLVNKHRTDKGLPSLEWSEPVAVQCRIHSQNMASGEVMFGHDGFEERADSIRVALSFISIAENVASNWGFEDPAQTAFDEWEQNSVHVANIEGDFNITGVGVARNEIGSYYFTQIFVRRE